jgi:signal transduction histidine kinase
MQSAVAVLRRPWLSPARDVVFALAITAVMLVGAYGEAHPGQPTDKIVNGHPVPHTPAAAFALVALAGLALAGRRWWPAAVLTISTAAVATYSLLGYVNGAALLAPPIALYALATRVSVRRALGAAAVTLVALMAATAVANPFGTTGGGFDLIPAMVAAACFGGIAIANRRAYVASIQARAEQDARRQIDEERLRIARELHDVVAHTMATINVQAGAAAHVAATRPQAAVEALQAIKTASKDGLRELRAILNVLRQADEADPTQPAPGIAQLGALIAGASRAGLDTTLKVSGHPLELPAAVDLAAYRIVQESLTNAIRHAGPASATVSLHYDDADLRIDIVDTGRGHPAGIASAGAGHGLAGMRERAASVGGTVETGPCPFGSGGYRVTARLPLSRRRAEGAAPANADGAAPANADGAAPANAGEGARP